MYNGVEENNLYFYHPDHLGSSSYITDKKGTVIQHTEYIAFGEILFDEHSVSTKMPYLFNDYGVFSFKKTKNEHTARSAELDSETGLYYYGARYYEPRTSIWLNVDPLAEKYPSISPYAYVANNPVMLVDPDGREGIVVSGSPGGHKNKNHFLVNGLYKAKASQKHYQRKGEKTTWIVYNDPTEGQGYTQKQIDKYKKEAAKYGITLKVVTDVSDIVDYVNNKYGGDSRKEDPITSFYYVGHAIPGDLNVGYGGTGENFEPDDFDSDAFSGGCHVNLVGGCRTTVPGWFEDSNVTQFQEILDKNSKIYGTNVRVYYSGGVVTDENLVKKNNGKIEERKGELPVKQ